jgi:hypothetical protein
VTDNGGSAVAALSLAGILTAQPFGLSIETIAIGTGFAVIGTIGRAAFEVQRSSEGQEGMKLSKIFYWLGAGFIGAPFVTIMYLVVLNLAHIQSDGISILGLLFFGFSGPRAVTWLLNYVISILNKRLGTTIPTLGPAPAKP